MAPAVKYASSGFRAGAKKPGQRETTINVTKEKENIKSDSDNRLMILFLRILSNRMGEREKNMKAKKKK
jgi:hypothetical protein